LKVARIPICPRGNAKLRAKGMIEIRHVSEARIQRNIEHPRRFQHQPSAEDILVWRKPGELLKNPKEVVAVKSRLSGKRSESVLRIRTTLDHSNDSRDPCFRSEGFALSRDADSTA
jgi:hypothetical protein